MSGFLIDTNVISEFTKPAPQASVVSWLQAADPNTLFASVITFGEIRLGIAAMPPSKRRESLEAWFSEGLPAWFATNLLAIDREIADLWGRLTIDARNIGITLATNDGFIAATALQRNLTLVTRNTKDFTGLGINLFNPWLP